MISRVWHTVKGDQKYIDASHYYKDRVVSMLQEEARLDNLPKGPFEQDIEKFNALSGMSVAAGFYENINSAEEFESRMNAELRQVSYGHRRGFHVVTLRFKGRIDANQLRVNLEKILGETPNVGEDATNTLLYVLPAPKIFSTRGFKNPYGIVISGRTSRYRERDFDSTAHKLVENAVERLKGSYEFNDWVHKEGYFPDFLIPEIARFLWKEGIKIPRTG